MSKTIFLQAPDARPPTAEEDQRISELTRSFMTQAMADSSSFEAVHALLAAWINLAVYIEGGETVKRHLNQLLPMVDIMEKGFKAVRAGVESHA